MLHFQLTFYSIIREVTVEYLLRLSPINYSTKMDLYVAHDRVLVVGSRLHTSTLIGYSCGSFFA